MPRLSVVIPVYNVEEFLPECLQSVTAQSFEDYEVLLVDDGSTDGSAAIAEEFARRDPRFRVISQANGGLSKARNTGTAHATGEYLAFLDSDDALAPNAYDLLVGSLQRTGSDFATGNVHRLTRFGTSQSPFLARAFDQTRLKTHVTKFRPLLSDRTAWNKVWRRSFWDRHGFAFPEGRIFEDTPVTVPAHFLADAVDVIADPVYYWRIRESGGSITQRRLEPRALRDRMTAIEEVSDHLARKGPRGAKQWYDETVVADDLRYYVNALEAADDEYRELFLDRVNAFLDKTSRRIFDPLPAIERLKWHLVRRRLMPQLVEVLRFQKQELGRTPPVRERGKWYGDYPFRTDRELRIPPSVYRLEGELFLRVAVEELAREDDRLHVRGYAYVHGIGAATEQAQRVEVTALRPGRLRRVRLLTSAVRARTRAVHRPDVTANESQALCDLSWSGFEAVLDPADLRGRRGGGAASWELFVTVRSGGVKRRRSRFTFDALRPLRRVELPGSPGLFLSAAATAERGVSIDARPQAATVGAPRPAGGDALEIAGRLALPAGAKPMLELEDETGERRIRRKLATDGTAFTGRLPIAELTAGADDEDGPGGWDLTIVEGGRRTPATLVDAGASETCVVAGRTSVLLPGPRGARLVMAATAPVISSARFGGTGELHLGGRAAADAGGDAVAFVHHIHGEQRAGALERDTDGGFSAVLHPARIASLAGELPLPEGPWKLQTASGRDAPGRLRIDPALADALPLSVTVDHKQFELHADADGQAVLVVRRDLDEDERGRYHQERQRRHVYGPARREALRDAVLYSSFNGRQYSDSPRAILEELVRREAPLDHLWVVRDARCRVPDGVQVVREGSRDYFEALARSRFVVFNDHFPDWFARRDGQTCVQTWHGTPFKRLGFDVSDMRRTVRRFQRGWERQVANWQYVVSPNAFATPILRRAYAIEGEMLETGYPRVDVLAGGDRDELGRRLREQLGIPPDKRTVLYAPTYRDHVVDRRGRYRLELELDVDRLRGAVGDDTVILFRKHHYIPDPAPATPDGFVRDVSSFPDGTELMLAADVLVTDYSSMMVDFANTGRPMLFHTYDLDAYRDEIRGFYIDFVGSVPGPLLRTTDDLAAALQDLDGVSADHAERYRSFRERFCALDDGHAAARVVDAVFTG